MIKELIKNLFKKKVTAYIIIEGKRVKLGRFESKDEAEAVIERIVKDFSIINTLPYEKTKNGYIFERRE